MDIQEAYQILEIDSNASKDTLRQRYLDLAAVWHPDRHSHNPRLQKIAEEKLKKINAAYDLISSQIKDDNHASGDQDITILTCKNCGARNRAKKDLAFYSKCGKCGELLLKRQNDDRRACGDDSCTGTIGLNGCCNYCGKSIEEGLRTTAYSNNINQSKTNNIEEKEKIKKRIVYSIIAVFTIIFIIYNNKQPSTPTTTKKPELSTPKKHTTTPVSNTLPTLQRISFRTQQSQPQNLENYNFNLDRLSKFDLLKIQTILGAIGYKPVTGKNTTIALKKYCEDFSFTPSNVFPEDFFLHSSFHFDIASEHSDWKEIYLANDFENWINNPNYDFRKKVLQVWLNNPNIIILLINKFKFQRDNPSVQPLPQTGNLKRNFREGLAPIEIVTKTQGKNHFIKLINKRDNKDVLSAFIRGGSTLSMDVPLGTYELKYAVGETWYGPQFLFGPANLYSRAKEDFTFTKTGNQYSGYTIELFLQLHGNLPTESISEFDF